MIKYPFLGVYRGSNPEQVKQYESWVGAPISYAVDFIGRDPAKWTIDTPGWLARKWAATSYRPVISAAMLPNKNYTLEAGAKGDYNDHWKKFGDQLVKNGCPDAILRLGHEFNGKFFPWSAVSKEQYYAVYWKEIVITLRNVPGQNFLFDWNPLAGVQSVDVEKAYPGDAYVDIIGLDAYDTALPKHQGKPEQRWEYQLNRAYGLNWHAAFAEKHKKPMSFPEWSIRFKPDDRISGGDNPYYISNMWKWFKTHNIKYAAYFEDDTNDGVQHRLMTGIAPKASAEYRRLVQS